MTRMSIGEVLTRGGGVGATSSGSRCAGSYGDAAPSEVPVVTTGPGSLRPDGRLSPERSAARKYGAALYGAVALAAAVTVAGCGGHGSKLSGTDRAATAGVCVTVSGDVATAASVGVRLAARSLTPAQAQTRLQPILTKVTAAAQQNARLPVGPKLQHLADAITAAEKADPAHPTQVRSAATTVGSAAKDVITSCAAVAK